MRELRTVRAVRASGTTIEQIRWAVRQGRWTPIIRGVLGRGNEPPSQLDISRATALATDGVIRGLNAAALHDFDGMKPGTPDVAVPRECRSRLPGVHRVMEMPDWVRLHQVKVTPADFTLFDIARLVDDDKWEQALEFCLRKGLIAKHEVVEMTSLHSENATRIRRVLKNRGGIDVPHTDSLLETLAIQLIRSSELPMPVRQFEIRNADGRPRYLDLCWPDLGIFLELDGQGHKDQPVYDASRQNEITRLTGWRCLRLTWEQTNDFPETTARELRETLVLI